MDTGGLRDISTLSTQRRPVSSAFSEHDEDMRDVDVTRGSDAALLEEGGYFSSDEDISPNKGPRRPTGVPGHTRHSSAFYDRSTSTRINPMPIGDAPAAYSTFLSRFPHLRIEREKMLSRPRVVFRAFSLIASGAVVGAISHLVWHYASTKEKKREDGMPVWPPNIRAMPTLLMLGIATYTFLTDLGFLIGSASPNFRYLRNKVVASLIGLNSLTSCIGWILSIAFSKSEKDSKPTLFWVCDAKESTDPSQQMDFALHCRELKTTWIAACIVAAAQALVVLTIILGFFGGRPHKPKFRSPRDASTVGRWSVFRDGTSEWINEKVKLLKR